MSEKSIVQREDGVQFSVGESVYVHELEVRIKRFVSIAGLIMAVTGYGNFNISLLRKSTDKPNTERR